MDISLTLNLKRGLGIDKRTGQVEGSQSTQEENLTVVFVQLIDEGYWTWFVMDRRNLLSVGTTESPKGGTQEKELL